MPLTSEAIWALGDMRLLSRMRLIGWDVDVSMLPLRVMERATAEALLCGTDLGDATGLSWPIRYRLFPDPATLHRVATELTVQNLLRTRRAIPVDPDKTEGD
jgi:hypothetical protein